VSAELRDFRGKLTAETDLALQAESMAFGRDKADIVREVLHAWALKKNHEHKVWANLARAEGFSGQIEGGSSAGQGGRGRGHR
jgi:hypothetical protein